jgi:TolB protein
MLMETEGVTAFAWAPDGSSIAVAEQLRPNVPVFDRLWLVSPDGSESSTLVDEQLVAFFWSPQGDQIAWIGIEPLGRAMDLVVSPVEAGKAAGEPRRLFRFTPTGELFALLSFFDQYAYSHSIWAPDGSAVVLTGTDGAESGRRNGSGPHGGQVYVVDVRTGEARRIASGKLAVWSWN